jgi:4'-phosphopantetheinyl transferase
MGERVDSSAVETSDLESTGGLYRLKEKKVALSPTVDRDLPAAATERPVANQNRQSTACLALRCRTISMAIRQNDGVPIALLPGDVHVWCRQTDSLADTEIRDAVALLSPEEHSRYTRFRFPRDQRDYAAAHALLRTSLSRYADLAPQSWQFQEAPGGKPAIVRGDGTPRLSFNLSHTHGLVACAIAVDADVGVDVESVDRTVDDGIARRYFSARENDDLQRCRSAPLRTRRFIELWTLKEAYIKAIGKGLSHPLDSIVFDLADRESILFLPPPGVDGAAWRFSLSAPTEHHRLAVAVRHARPLVSRIRLMPEGMTGGDV